jgi:CHASE3 domain sensor protein
VENPLLSILALVALVLLLAVTGGISYLTLADWRDRRRQQDENRSLRRTTAKRR